MDLQELRTAARLIDRLAKRAMFAEKQMVALEGQCAEWKRIADELKAERNAERKAHDEYKERNRELFNQNQRLTAELVVIKDERGALRAQLDTERERHKQKTRAHPVKVGEYVRDADGKVRQVREVHVDWYLLSTGYSWTFDYCTPCDPPTASHDTPEGKAVAESASEDIRVGDMVEVFQKTSSDTLFDDVSIHGTVSEVFWAETGNKCVRLDSSTMNRRSRGGSYFAYCDVRKIAKETAQAAVEPKPGDVVRLVRVPTHTDLPAMLPWSNACGMPGDTATVVIMAVPDKLPSGTIPVRTGMGRAFFWPLSCVEAVKGGGK